MIPESKTVQYLDMARVSARKSTETPRNPYVSGYGNEIPTQHMLKIGRNWHRVYVTQHSNAGSAYVRVLGKKLFLRDTDLL